MEALEPLAAELASAAVTVQSAVWDQTCELVIVRVSADYELAARRRPPNSEPPSGDAQGDVDAGGELALWSPRG